MSNFTKKVWVQTVNEIYVLYAYVVYIHVYVYTATLQYIHMCVYIYIHVYMYIHPRRLPFSTSRNKKNTRSSQCVPSDFPSPRESRRTAAFAEIFPAKTFPKRPTNIWTFRHVSHFLHILEIGNVNLQVLHSFGWNL